MEDQPKLHASLTIKVNEPIPGMDAKMGYCQIEIKGCRDCLQNALTNFLLCDPAFKELVNKSVRAANEIKGRTQN